MTAIPGAAHTMRVLADGVLRVQIDIDPTHRQAAFALLGEPGRQVAIAALIDGSQAPGWGKNTEAMEPKLARTAAIMCANPTFHLWLQSKGVPVSTAEAAAQWMRSELNIQSRAELDTDPEAEQRFHTLIRKPFRDWQTRVDDGIVEFNRKCDEIARQAEERRSKIFGVAGK